MCITDSYIRAHEFASTKNLDLVSDPNNSDSIKKSRASRKRKVTDITESDKAKKSKSEEIIENEADDTDIMNQKKTPVVRKHKNAPKTVQPENQDEPNNESDESGESDGGTNSRTPGEHISNAAEPPKSLHVFNQPQKVTKTSKSTFNLLRVVILQMYII